MKGCLVGLPTNQIRIGAKSEHRVSLFAQLDWQTVSANNRDVLGSRSSFADSRGKEVELTIRLEDTPKKRVSTIQDWKISP